MQIFEKQNGELYKNYKSKTGRKEKKWLREGGREAERVLPVAQHRRICGEVLSSELPNILEMASEEKDLYSE